MLCSEYLVEYILNPNLIVLVLSYLLFSVENPWLMPLASQYLLLVMYNVQAYIKMLFRVTC